MDSIPKRIKNRGILLRDRGIQFPDVRLGDHHELGKCPVRIHADDFHVVTDVGLTGTALQAFAAGHVHLRGNKVSLLHAGNFVATGYNLAAKFMPGNQRRMNPSLSPSVPLINMQIGAADRGHSDFDQNFCAAKCGHLHLSNFRSRRRIALHNCQHRFRHLDHFRKNNRF